jgi:hypothetical protein
MLMIAHRWSEMALAVFLPRVFCVIKAGQLKLEPALALLVTLCKTAWVLLFLFSTLISNFSFPPDSMIVMAHRDCQIQLAAFIASAFSIQQLKDAGVFEMDSLPKRARDAIGHLNEKVSDFSRAHFRLEKKFFFWLQKLKTILC